MTEKFTIQCLITSVLTAISCCFVMAWLEDGSGETSLLGKISATAFFLNLFLTAFFALMAIWTW